MTDSSQAGDDEARALEAVRALAGDGQLDVALSALRRRLRWPEGKHVRELAGWLALLAELAERRGAVQLADVAREAVRDPDSPDRLYDLGYALIDSGAPSIAASVLWRCLALVGESEEVVCELVSALESALAYEDAYAILEQHAALRGRSFLCEYLFAFNAAMTGKLEVTRAAFAELRPDSDETEGMRETIAAILARADRIAGISPLDARDLRGWQYVLTGTLVTHHSPYGFDEPMHGRYAWLRDSLAHVATGIRRLVPLVRATAAPCVYAPPGRGHEIVAHAAAAILELPLMPWPAIGVPAPGVVVVHDLAELPATDVLRLAQRKPDQILYAHASPWTRDLAIAPDVTTLLYETLVPAWGELVVTDPTTQQITRQPADEREIDVIAAEIIASAGLRAGELAPDDLASWDALVAATWPPEPGVRSRLWAGGPVPSNRFE
jgi:hypothetical protein